MASTTEVIESGELRLTVEFDFPVGSASSKRRWLEWLQDLAASVQTVTGTHPEPELLIQLKSSWHRGDAIAFGQVRRSDPPRIRFHVRPDATAEMLTGDWRGHHEFAHLMIPFPGNDDIWFTEGFASYYQYLLQARTDVISPDQAWQALHDGFQRGLNDRHGRGQTLRKLSPRMWQEQAFRRVYWTGAAYFLRVDTRLRSESAGRYSLDQTIADFQQCCRGQKKRWNAESLIRALGKLSVPAIWQEEYRVMIDQPAEPSFEKAMQRLGIRERGDRLYFDDVEAARALRQAITAGQ